MPTNFTFHPVVAVSVPQWLDNAKGWGIGFLSGLVILIGLYLLVRAAVKSHGALGAIVAAGVAAIALVVIVKLLTSGQGAKIGEDTVKYFEVAVPPGTGRAVIGLFLGA